MNILALVPDLKAPSCRFRVLQFVGPLAAEGVKLEVRELSRCKLRRWRLLRSSSRFDAVFLHRKLLNNLDYRVLKKHARRLIYDFDDALIYRDSNATEQSSRVREKKFRRLVSGADLVIAGNNYLSDLARPWCREIAVLPTVVDLADYPAEASAGSGKVIGWMGSKSNFIYLDLLRPALEELSRADPEIEFSVVSNGTPDLPSVPTKRKSWSREEEVADLLGFDVGVMPLLDDPWTRGKCALKIIQYFAAFLPVVCSPVGANLEVVEEGVNGCFAREEKEWWEGLKLLLGSAGVREEMGRAGRKLVEEKYSLAVAVPQILSLLRKTVD